MPYKKMYKKKPLYKRRRYYRKRVKKLPRSLRPKTYNFHRSFTSIVQLGNGTNGGWTQLDASLVNGPQAMVQQMQFSLADLNMSGEFTNLFAQYKINAVSMKLYFANTNSTNTANRQTILYVAPWRTGDVESLTEHFFLNTQKHKTKLCMNTIGKPVTIYCPMKQLNRLYVSDSTYTTSIQKPKYIGTSSPTVPHFGLNLRIQKVDGADFTSGTTTGSTLRWPAFKQEIKIYFSCRQVE